MFRRRAAKPIPAFACAPPEYRARLTEAEFETADWRSRSPEGVFQT